MTASGRVLGRDPRRRREKRAGPARKWDKIGHVGRGTLSHSVTAVPFITICNHDRGYFP